MDLKRPLIIKPCKPKPIAIIKGLLREIVGLLFRSAYFVLCIARFEKVKIVPIRFSESNHLFVQDTVDALKLLKEVSPRHFTRVRQFIKYIINAELRDVVAEYIWWMKGCRVSYYQISKLPRKLRVPYYASVIVHEATHGLLAGAFGVYSQRGNQRVEEICFQEQLRFAQKTSLERLCRFIKRSHRYQKSEGRRYPKRFRSRQKHSPAGFHSLPFCDSD